MYVILFPKKKKKKTITNIYNDACTKQMQMQEIECIADALI